MSNWLAAATVTETIAQVIRDAVSPVVAGAEVTTAPPAAAAGDAAARVNVFLYQVAHNASLRNSDLPLRDGHGGLQSRPRTPLDLFYILTFHGREEQLVPQQLLGLTAAALHLHARLTRHDVARAVAAAPGGFLDQSDLAEQTEPINVSPHTLTIDELSKLWTTFQTPYALSASYHCSVVMIDGPPPPQALPVRSVGRSVSPGGAPMVRSVAAETPGQPIVAGGRVVVRGLRLGGTGAQVSVGEVTLAPGAGSSDTQLVVTLGDARLEAGPAALVVRSGGASSPPAAFVLAPTVTTARARPGKTGEPASLQLTLDPPVWSTTPVVVLLNGMEAGAGAAPPAYAFDLPLPAAGPPPLRVSTVTVPIPGVAAGTYLVRVEVNGAQSPLAARPRPGGVVRYVSPKVTVP